MPTDGGTEVPPLFIWDPRPAPPSDDGDGDDDFDFDDEGWFSNASRNQERRKVGDGEEGGDAASSRDGPLSPSSVERRRRGKFVHASPPAWSEASVRTQLWDAFRLARVVLGGPVRDKRLTNHSILRAIQGVAEMRLQILSLSDEVDGLRRQEQQQQLEKRRPHEQQQQAFGSDLDAAWGQPHHPDRSPQQQQQQQQQLEHPILQETDSSTETPHLSESSSSSLASGGDGGGGDNAHVDGVAIGTYQVASVPSAWDADAGGGGGGVASIPPAAATGDEDDDRHRREEELLLLRREQHGEVERLLGRLDERVRESSAATSAEIRAVHAQLADAQGRQTAAHLGQLQGLRDELEAERRRHALRTHEMEALHARTVADLREQIAPRREREHRQEGRDGPQGGREPQPPPPQEASAVRRALQSVPAPDEKRMHQVEQENRGQPASTGTGTGKSGASTSDDGGDEHDDNGVYQPGGDSHVQTAWGQVPTAWGGHHTDDGLERQWEAAVRRRAETEDRHGFLQLQRDLLRDDVREAKPEGGWAELLGEQQSRYLQELDELSLQEARQLEEMEALEAELTHLAFVFVHCEDLGREFQQRQQEQKDELQSLRAQSEATVKRMRRLRDGVDGNVREAGRRLAAELPSQGGRPDPTLSAEQLRVQLLERALARRDDELLQTKAQLKLSEDRLQELRKVSSPELRRTYGGSGDSACPSIAPVDYDTDSTATTIGSRAARMGSK